MPDGGHQVVRRWRWAVGGVLALVVLGPALAPGSLFLLDAVFVADLPVPSGVWGLGPELPRRLPLGVAVSWISSALSGGVAGRVLVFLAVAGAFAGAARLARGAPWYAQLTAGLIYAASPLMLTRVGAGQWTAFVPFAVLPWVLPSLLQPGRRPARTFLAAAALGATGSVGGTLALLAVLVGLVAERARGWRLVGLVGLLGLAQLPWVVPALVVSGSDLDPASAAAFATKAPGLIGVASLFAGGGFWRTSSQVGGPAGLASALLGAGLLALAGLGTSALPREWRGRALALAGLGTALALASALPGVSEQYRDVTGSVVGGLFRESQRFLVLTLAWLAPAAAYGAVRLAHRPGWLPAPVTLALPGVAALVLAGPGLWGVGGRLRPLELPPEWERARTAVQQTPGTTLALPYHRYLDLPFGHRPRVLNPLPDHLGGDVISSSDPEIGRLRREAVDPREPQLLLVLSQARQGEPVAADLARLGVRWVVLLHTADWRAYQSMISEPGLRVAVSGPTLELFEVRAWPGALVDDQGVQRTPDPVVEPLQALEPSPSASWARPWQAGWMRGSEPASPGPSGLVHLPAGAGPLWFWPSLVVLVADAATLAAVVVAWRLRTRGGSSGDVAGDRAP
jgi:hypothetical protein